MLALLGYCVLVIDSRGSDYRGMAFESHLYRRMGTVEISDQVQGIEYAANKFNCIDVSRIGIFGWSYGGYMALMGLAQRPDVFKVYTKLFSIILDLICLHKGCHFRRTSDHLDFV